MKIKIKRFDTNFPLPEYQSPGAAAMDLHARTTITIQPQTVELVPLNIALQIPKNCWVQISARSSLHKKGVLLVNGIGVGDSDYSGDQDEYKAALLNFTNQPVTIEAGQRIVQMMVLQYERMELEEVDRLEEKNRGGFGSTGM